MEVNQYERHDVLADTPALKAFRMLIAKAASHRHTEHGHHKVIATLDAAVALFFHADMDEVVYAEPPAEAEPGRTVVWLLPRLITEREKLHDCGKSFCAIKFS